MARRDVKITCVQAGPASDGWDVAVWVRDYTDDVEATAWRRVLIHYVHADPVLYSGNRVLKRLVSCLA